MATGLSVAGAGLLTASANAASPTAMEAIVSILSVARTAEQLAVTFYTNGVNNATALGLSGPHLDYLKAFLIEEQIHQLFFASQGGLSLADTFSFPSGAMTFTDLPTFIKTQQQLEGAFDSAFVSAVKEFASPPINSPALAQIGQKITAIQLRRGLQTGDGLRRRLGPQPAGFGHLLFKGLHIEPVVLGGVEFVLAVIEEDPLAVAQHVAHIVQARFKVGGELLRRGIRPQLQPDLFPGFAVQVFLAQRGRAGFAFGFAGVLQQEEEQLG